MPLPAISALTDWTAAMSRLCEQAAGRIDARPEFFQLAQILACLAGSICYSKRARKASRHFGWVAQLVEQGTENPRVRGSIPFPATRSDTTRRPSVFGSFSLRSVVFVPLTLFVGALRVQLLVQLGARGLKGRLIGQIASPLSGRRRGSASPACSSHQVRCVRPAGMHVRFPLARLMCCLSSSRARACRPSLPTCPFPPRAQARSRLCQRTRLRRERGRAARLHQHLACAPGPTARLRQCAARDRRANRLPRPARRSHISHT